MPMGPLQNFAAEVFELKRLIVCQVRGVAPQKKKKQPESRTPSGPAGNNADDNSEDQPDDELSPNPSRPGGDDSQAG